ncbi:hypothetical protein PENSPDRAFT_691159 [Peniophora sp. CONT]|nr:hypothetical protein PENSPDRAFT_691159 [Peniophora sp. CONT]
MEDVVVDPAEAVADAEDSEHIDPPPPSPPASEGHSLLSIPRSASLQPINSTLRDIPFSASPESAGTSLSHPHTSSKRKGPPSAWSASRPGHADGDSGASVAFDLPVHSRGSPPFAIAPAQLA